MAPQVLVGRESERDTLGTLVEGALDGRGGVVLLSGEAGVGKTRFAEEALAGRQAAFVRGAAGPAAPAYAPIVGALRALLRERDVALDGPLRSHLALLLPELGEAPAEGDRAALYEAIRGALEKAAAEGPVLVLLDDLQWSDDATLELLAVLAPWLCDLPLLVVGAYRSDEVPRTHRLRWLRNELRRGGCLHELSLDPLDAECTGEVAEGVLGARPSPRLAATLYERTAGIPFFIEELAAALRASDRLEEGDEGLELELDGDVPLPQTIRDAVLLQTADLSPEARGAAEAASVAGSGFDLDLVAELGGEEGLDELLGTGLIEETEQGRAAFRHPLARDAIYDDVPWARRRALHRTLAERLTDHAEVAAHSLAARDGAKALDSLAKAVVERAAVHAYRDAARLGRQALDLWPEGERPKERIEMLERHARFAELSGELTDAARAQREVVTTRRSEDSGRALADAGRRLATIYELQGDRDKALGARQVAAEAYSANELPGEAASERLAAASYHHSAGRYSEALEELELAGESATRAERIDLRARILGLRGVTRVKAGDYDAGVEEVRAGLALALDNELTLTAAEVYQRLGTAQEITGDYGGARDALATAVGFCEIDGGDAMEYTCLSCMAYVLRELGDWAESEKLCEQLRAPGNEPSATLVADGVLGAMDAWRGNLRAARAPLDLCLQTAKRINVVSMTVDSAAALAWLDEAEGDLDSAREHARFLLERWQGSEDHHYAVWGLRWAAGFFARQGDLADARACADGLSSISTATGHLDAVAALAHALGEIALADGEPQAAAEQMTRAAALHEQLDIPFERAQIGLRAGVALAAASQREEGLELMCKAHVTARKLGAAPLAAEIADEVAKLGESVEERLGKRAAADHDNAGLSKRELEVMRLVASGRTNREIAGELVLSTRTVDMHVRNILTKLRCRSRTEAATKAGELGLLA